MVCRCVVEEETDLTMVTFHHRDSLPRVDCLAKSSRSHSSSPHARPHSFFRFHVCNAQYNQGKDNREQWRHHNKLRTAAPPILGGGYKPTLASDRDGGELAHSRDPGFVVVAIFLRVYRQASRYVLLLFTLASSMTCLPLVTLARYRWHYISHLGPFSYGISQRRYGVSREQAAVHHPYGDRSSTSSYPLRYPCSLLAYDTRV